MMNNYFNLVLQIIGSASGAFFAFLFGMVTYIITKNRERWAKHKNALVEIEYLANEHLDDIAGNVSGINGTLEIFKNNKFTYNRLRLLSLADDLELRLGDINIINQYFNYKVDIQRINEDFNTWNRANELLHSAILTGHVHPDDIKKNKDHLAHQASEIKKYLSLLNDGCKSLLVLIRLRLKKEQNYKTYLLNKIANKLSPPTRNEAKDELKKLTKEMDETEKKHKSKLDSLREI